MERALREAKEEAERRHAGVLDEAIQSSSLMIAKLQEEHKAAMNAFVCPNCKGSKSNSWHKDKAFYAGAEGDSDDSGGDEGDVYDCSTHELHEVSQSRRKHARAFAQSVFADMQSGLQSGLMGQDSMPLQSEARAYFKVNGLYQIL